MNRDLLPQVVWLTLGLGLCAIANVVAWLVEWLVEDAVPAVTAWVQEKPRDGDMIVLCGLTVVILALRLRERRRAR